MGTSIAVNSQSFETAVLEKSYGQTIIVDFFATWCGPCQMLKPMLEKLVLEYNFVLAKVDIDESPDLAQKYGVTGVPDVRIVVDGQVQTGFVGMLPEPELRQLLQRLHLTSELDQKIEAIYEMASEGDVSAAGIQLQALQAQYPNDRGLILEAANFYIETNQLDLAETILGKIPQSEPEFASRANGLRVLIQLKQAVAQEPASDMDRQYQAAAQQTIDQDYANALPAFLAIVTADRQYRLDAGRKGMLAIFDLLGNDHPLTKEYRKQLMMAMY
jgi:putative thioredoxin